MAPASRSYSRLRTAVANFEISSQMPQAFSQDQHLVWPYIVLRCSACHVLQPTQNHFSKIGVADRQTNDFYQVRLAI
jgi:hypothetical protein